jgi:hypothetical protein
MRKLDRTAEHRAAADLLFGIFKASIALEQISGTFRSSEADRGIRALARTLNEIRRVQQPRTLRVQFRHTPALSRGLRRQRNLPVSRKPPPWTERGCCRP